MKAIKNAKIVLPDRILEGKTLMIERDRISEFRNDTESIDDAESITNAQGKFLMPGFIDIHSDRMEQFMMPCSTARVSMELALKECERELLLQGITTVYHSLPLYKDELLKNMQGRYHLIHHKFHIRLEIDNMEAFPIVRKLIEQKKIHEISFMDHTPGQGQYRKLEVHHETVRNYGGKESMPMNMNEIMAYHQSQKTLSTRQLKLLAELAHQNNVTVASYHDDSLQKLELNKELGVDICVFPVKIETARYARMLGFKTVAGATDILLGGSHSGNMSALEAILEDCADILCSDYYPPAILHSIFIMWKDYGKDLPEMVCKATKNPAIAVGIDKDYGTIEAGKKADLILVEQLDGYPVITQTLVDGMTTASLVYRR